MSKHALHIILLLAALTTAGCSAYPSPFEPSYADDALESKVITAPFEVTDIVTVKRSEAGIVFLQYGPFRLIADGLDFTRQQRAMASMMVFPEMSGDFYKCRLEWLEPLDEGFFGSSHMVPSSVDRAPLDISFNSSYTRVEDGYLTLKYSSWWGLSPLHHDFYLVSDPERPYALTLVQDSHGDSRDNCSEGLVSFDINGLPDTAGETITISVNWTKLDGTGGTAYFGFKTRE